MAIFNSYFDITRGYLWTSLDGCPMVSRSFDTAEALDVDIGAYVQKISSLDDWWRWWQQFLLAYPGLSSNYGILWGYRISRKLGILWGYRISRKLAAYIKLGFNVSITRQIRWFMVHMYCTYIYNYTEHTSGAWPCRFGLFVPPMREPMSYHLSMLIPFTCVISYTIIWGAAGAIHVWWLWFHAMGRLKLYLLFGATMVVEICWISHVISTCCN